MGVANLATERGMRVVMLAPKMFGQEPPMRIRKLGKEARNSQKGEGKKGEREKVIPRSETQGKMTKIKGSASTGPEGTGIASSGTRAGSSTKVPRVEEE